MSLTLFPRDLFSPSEDLSSSLWLRTFPKVDDLRPLPIDVVEDEDKFAIKADVPGVTKDSIHVKAKDGVLTIEVVEKKEADEDKEDDGVKYHRTERSQSFVSRSLKMPKNADLKHVVGHYDAGVLTLNIPKLKKLEKEDGERIMIE
jgi:HSP20 family protein